MSPEQDVGRGVVDDAVIQVACFAVGDQEYCLDIMRIKEIVNPIAVASVPKAPPFIEGVCELRGAFFAVMDLRKRFAVPTPTLTRDSKYIVVTLGEQNAGQPIALIVDRVIEVRRVARSDIGPVPSLAVGPEARFVAGVARWDERTVLFVDLEEVLTPDEQHQVQRLAGPTPG